MVDVLVATVAFVVVLAVLLVGLVLVTVAPVYAALQMAETRGFSTFRWALVSAAAVLVGLGAAYVLRGHDVPKLLPLLPLVLTWTGSLLLWLLDASQTRLGGRAGLHE
ncbi:MAG: hypothetical protein JWN77_1165 [Frankiales bacterium]|jgi:hypothetical protein|nr:hypothetical protein [Frankiales bacterium]